MWKVGDFVQLKDNPWDEQIPEDIERYHKLKSKAQEVTEVKDVSHLEGTSGQWVKTDLIDDWTDSNWFKKPDLSEVLLGFYHELASEQKDLPPEVAQVIDEEFWDLI